MRQININTVIKNIISNIKKHIHLFIYNYNIYYYNMEKLPIDIERKIFSYLSHPIADILRPHINECDKYKSYLCYRCDIMDFTEFMMVNAMYLDQTSKVHIRMRRNILNCFNKN